MVKKITKLLLLTTLILALTVNMVSATLVSHTVTPNSIDTYIEDSYEYRSRLEIGGVLYGASREVGINPDDDFEVMDEYGYLMGGVSIDTMMDSKSILLFDHYESGGLSGQGGQYSTNDVPVPGNGNLGIARMGEVDIGYISTTTEYYTWTAATHYESSVGALGSARYQQESTYSWLGASQETGMSAIGMWEMDYLAVDMRGSPDYLYGFEAGGMGWGDAHVETTVIPAISFFGFFDITPDNMMTSNDYEAGGFSTFSSTAYGESGLLGGSSTSISFMHVEVDDWYWGW